MHVFQQEVEQSSLVNGHVRKLGKSVANVLHTAVASDPSLVTRVRAPEVSLVNPVGLAGQPLGQAEGIEHLDRTARHAPPLAAPQPSPRRG